MHRPRLLPALLAAAVVLGGAACSDDDPDEATTGTEPGATDVAPTDASSATDDPTAGGIDDLPPLPEVSMTVALTVDGGRVVAEATVTNASADDVAVLPLDLAVVDTDDGVPRLRALRTRGADGDDAPPQVDAVHVAAGGDATFGEDLGRPDGLPTGDLTVCLEGDVLAGGPAPSDDDPPTVAIGPRGDAAGIVCADPTPVPEG